MTQVVADRSGDSCGGDPPTAQTAVVADGYHVRPRNRRCPGLMMTRPVISPADVVGLDAHEAPSAPERVASRKLDYCPWSAVRERRPQ